MSQRSTSSTIDSREVNRALREIVWPTVKAFEFSRRTQRTAWRDRAGAIQVVNFATDT